MEAVTMLTQLVNLLEIVSTPTHPVVTMLETVSTLTPPVNLLGTVSTPFNLKLFLKRY